MPKRLTVPKSVESIIASDDVGVLSDVGRIKTHYESLTDFKKKQRFVAFLNSFYIAPQISKMLGLTTRQIHYAVEKNTDIRDSAQLARCVAIGDLCGRKAMEILQQTDVEKIDDKYKPKAVKDLMDAMDIAGMNVKPRQERDDDDTIELVMKIRKRMKGGAQREEDEERKEINITDDVEVQK